MKILSRLLLTILPPVLSIIVLGSIVVLQVSNSGANQQENDFLNFKARQLEDYVISQWNILVEFRLYYDPDLIRSAQRAVFEYAGGLITVQEQPDENQDRMISRFIDRIVAWQVESDADTTPEVIFALVQDQTADSGGLIAFSTDEALTVSAEEAQALLSKGEAGDGVTDFAITPVNGVSRAYSSFAFEPFNWVVYVSETVNTFQRTQSIVRVVSIFIIILVLIIITCLIVFLSNTITRPLSQMSKSTRDIISDIPDIKTTVPVVYSDESGILAQNFNSVFAAINRNYQQLKEYTYRNIVIQKREARIKTIFQKYVPQTLIDRYVHRPESLLQSESRDIAIFFMDIRGFTSISESMAPAEVVKMLNSIFGQVVEQVHGRGGHVDKYIGDAIMAIYGAPTRGTHDCLSAVKTALAVFKEVQTLNASPDFKDYPTINVGVGIHYGDAVVGNVGCDAKLDYTAIGDTVNAASRIEALCKKYRQKLLISENVVEKVQGDLGKEWNVRLVDNIVLSGKKKALGIYTLAHSDFHSPEGLALYKAATADYIKGDFTQALQKLNQAYRLMPKDFLVQLFITRAREMQKVKLPENWSGVYIATSK